MELKVWVEGIQRIVCGVTETTTCQDVVYALAYATAQSGRFTLVERWRNNERFLAPYENPLTILMKWGEYSSDVQLILRRSSTDGTKNQNQSSVNSRSPHGTRANGMQGNQFDPLVINRGHDNGRNSTTNSTSDCNESPEVLKRNRDIRKSLTFSGLHGTSSEGNTEVQTENIAVVQPTLQSKSKDGQTRRNVQKSTDSPTRGSTGEGVSHLQQKKVREVPPYRDPPGPESSPHRTLPPYRDPPPPIVTSPTRSQASEAANDNYSHLKDEQSSPNHPKSKRNLNQELQDSKNLMQNKTQNSQSPNMVTVAYTQRYAELIRLVNRQRDTINAQQVDLTKFDAEILYWENKNREHFNQMDYISQEINRIESTGRLIDEQLNELVHTEEESELVRQQEKTLKSEITLLRSKLANCETELLQCKNKIRLVMEELALEQHNINRESEERMLVERKVVNEMERLQNDVEQAKRLAEHTNQAAEALKQEVSNLEAAIVEKKMQVERLVADMKEANLQSLTVACQDEQIKHLLEGAQKPGSTRKMIGSPRQLETAVPTSKNPHGVWV
ncbi:ras association domain-containing protein 8 isoform X1 [Diachasmimorpha longicaudata]|uniref:ras association domain-containing protein 8 isoform X1 n=1 Tax=Diachasmimorpha longicaudata TaxID=58733 RepID=UPI0030B874E4